MVIADQSCSFYATFPVRAGNRVKFVKIKLQDCLKGEDTSITVETAAPERKKTK
ncbi:hypothetical protein [Klebsiella africana]|uniref:hypothetical protein n=1 Tax=Klebsiella africana TaxID=2489010 RepID=UPI001932B310|nr:hypothetical protein [Klebsiella africana]QRF13995.1 hypothetical protein H1X61_07415 [Klebsiella africana]